MKVIVAQKGSREHFLAARALHRRGLLTQLVVDWYAPGWAGDLWSVADKAVFPFFRFSVFQRLVKRLRSALASRCDEIPDHLIRANWITGLMGKWQQSLSPFGRSPYAKALQADIAFTKAVARCQLPPHDVLFGYSYMSLELLELERGREVLTILDQIDPGPVEFRLVAEELAANPELAGLPQPYPTRYYERLKREWKLADIIIVNSEWSRDALISEGVPPTKIEILPLAYEINTETLKAEILKTENSGQKTEVRKADTPHPSPLPIAPQRGEGTDFQLSTFNFQLSTAPLRVLWLGQVNVRKGIHYLIEAARLLERENIQFDVVGPIGILPQAVKLAPPNMRFHGPVSRDRAAEWYQQSDVFVLPTLSDGFALTQLEALAHGLPVIATPNCGRVVEDGKTGYIVPARDAHALAAAIKKFATDRRLTSTMAPVCREAVKAYSVDAYGKHLIEIICKHCKRMECKHDFEVA